MRKPSHVARRLPVRLGRFLTPGKGAASLLEASPGQAIWMDNGSLYLGQRPQTCCGIAAVGADVPVPKVP